MSTIDQYLKVHDKGKKNQLHLGIVKPYNEVKTATVSRWIKKVLDASGVDTDQDTPSGNRDTIKLLKNLVKIV